MFMCVKITEHCVNIKHYEAASSAPVIVHFAANLTTVLEKKNEFQFVLSSLLLFSDFLYKFLSGWIPEERDCLHT